MADRTERLSAAIALARKHPPLIDTGHAGPWLDERLAVPQQTGVRRVIFHSMVTQYMSQAERDHLMQSMRMAAIGATPTRPLVRIGLEWREDRREVQLHCTLWDGSVPHGRSALVATCHPYAEWFDWRGLDA